MLSIKPLGLGSAEEELASIGVGASIGHGENSSSSVLQGEVLILELVAVDGLATSSVMVGEVATLHDKQLTDQMAMQPFRLFIVLFWPVNYVRPKRPNRLSGSVNPNS